jgi:hypothetical protein
MSEHRPARTHWRKSTHSGSQSGECVEVAQVMHVIAVRDSKDPDGPVLILEPAQWHALRQLLRPATRDADELGLRHVRRPGSVGTVPGN